MMATFLLPGTFDPPTLGHLELIRAASKLCATLYVGIGNNFSKKGERLLSIEDTLRLLKEELRDLPHIKVVSFSGLTSSFAQEIGATALIRGIRDGHDLESEIQIADINRTLSGLETLFIPSHPSYRGIRSTFIRELAYHKAPLESFLPKPIAEAINRRNK